MIKDKLKKINNRFASDSFYKTFKESILLLTNLFHFKERNIKVVQMPVINVCNSNCVMCNICKSRDARQLSPEEYTKILSNKFFKHVTNIGINGGEPTLKTDLLEVIKVCHRELKHLRTINIITNGIQGPKIFLILQEINNYLKDKNIKLDVCVSIDGLEETHDKNRGIPGNFKSSWKLIEDLKKEGIYVWFGATLTKINLYAADDIVLLAERLALPYFEIRMAVDIKRLYNDGFFENEHFNKDELFHLCQFFQSRYIKTNDIFYYSLFRQLAYNKPRLAGCRWQETGVTLNASGDLSYCSVASPNIGSCLTDDPSKIYRDNESVRTEIKKNVCDSCMHDLRGSTSAKNSWFLIKKYAAISLERVSKALMLKKINYLPAHVSGVKERPLLKDAKVITITGWWGTETHGDKAILGELFCFLKQKAPKLEKVYLTCFEDMEYVVVKTIEELAETGVCDVSLFAGTIPIRKFYNSKEFKESDFTIIGGGPLERISELVYIEKAFEIAHRAGKGTMIFGCGIDPNLFEYKSLVKNLLLNSTYILLRDKESLGYANKMTGGVVQAFHACDPAFGFVKKWKNINNQADDSREGICTLVRANTNEYLVDENSQEIEKQNKILFDNIALFLDSIEGRVDFLSMNNIWIGADDRLASRKLYELTKNKNHINTHDYKYMGLHELLNFIQKSEMALAVRYHAHIFCIGLNTPFLSVDYTGKGNKIENLLNVSGLNDFSLEWGRFNEVDMINKYKFIKDNYSSEKEHMQKSFNYLCESLEMAYEKID